MISNVNHLLNQIDLKLKSDNLQDVEELIYDLNGNLEKNEHSADLYPKLSEAIKKVSAVINTPSAKHDKMKRLSAELTALDLHTITLHPRCRQWPSLIALIKCPLDDLQEELNSIPNADKSISEGEVENYWLNRYSNVIPYNFNRYQLSTRYISASDATLNGKRYLIGSAPFRKTVRDWWRMIIESDTRLIVAATNLTDSRGKRCFPYWETRDKINRFLKPMKNWRCDLLSQEECLDQAGCQKIIKRVIVLQGPIEEKREITHLHFLNWPDSGIADTRLSMKFREIIAKEEAKNPKHPPLFHCSAGIGRTGVVLAIHLIMNQIQESKDPEIDVKKVIKTLRAERPYMVQSAAQVKMIARVALEALLNA